MSTKGRINVYVCDYGCRTVTVDVDEGVTPFMIRCRARSTQERPLVTDSDGYCKGLARSCMYPQGPLPDWATNPEWEWYKPSSLGGLSAQEVEHVKKGGLLLRSRTSEPEGGNA